MRRIIRKGKMSEIVTPTPAALAKAALLLQQGKLVAMPTETVYGLAADATNDHAVAAIYAAKGRPSFNPLIIHGYDFAQLAAHVQMDNRAEELAAHFWPGPLTLILPRHNNSRISLLASAGLPSLAVRIPQHKVALDLLRMVQTPLAAPSANPSGYLSPTTAQHVAQSLGDKVALILASGKSSIGVESTVLDLTQQQVRILRPGAITAEMLAAIIGQVDTIKEADKITSQITSPGQMSSHYAPNKPLRLNAQSPNSNEVWLTFGPSLEATHLYQLSLSDSGDLTEAAANLFVHLHTAEQMNVAGIAVMPIPETGLGIAINDRLKRAAADKN